MKRIFLTYAITAAIAVILAGCSNQKKEATDAPAVDVTVNRLDIAAINGDSAAFISMEPGASTWLAVIGADPADIDGYFRRVADKPYNSATVTAFTPADSLEQALGSVFASGRSLGLFDIPAKVYAVASPYNQTIVTADSLLFIALNHYLGPERDFYAYFPDFARRGKSADRIGIDAAEALIAASHPFRPDSPYPTALQRMVYEGALVEAVMQLTEADEQEVLGYTDEEYGWLRANEADAWRSMLARDMIFSTDPDIVDGLVRPNAVTSVLHHESPGRTGRFIGHRIITAALNRNPTLTVVELLSPEFYLSPTLLENAGYAAK